ncbi:heterokaryon incompatibility protein-domain-containing protein [Xylaria cubensis]|nr:heterokaryon incompatibility protein-domain-containing protein [Xylaria cubensis]
MADVEGSLCDTCMKALRSKFRYIEEFTIRHHPKYENLIASAKNDCFICAWLLAGYPSPTMLENSGNDILASKDFTVSCKITHRSSRSSEKDGFFGCSFSVSSSWAPEFRLEVACLRGNRDSEFRYDRDQPPLSWEDLKAHPWLELDPNIGLTHHSLRAIKTWIARCEAKHEHCYKPPTFFPSRVIDVQDVELGTVCLVDKEKVIEAICKDRAAQDPVSTSYPPYWTLSHRWGDPKDILQLTKKVERDFRKSISTGDLTPTFRDAALLVRRLGFKYIWIDSLCIFQDSISDWQREAANMVHIYRNSYCNISAAAASQNPSKEGLFRKRRLNTRLLYPFVIKQNLDPENDEEADTPWMIWDDSTWFNEVEGAPLSTRGWVVQERFLATRVVHYTSNRIFWECLGGAHCEVGLSSRIEPIQTDNTGFAKTSAYKSTRLEIERYKINPGGPHYRAIDTGNSGFRFHQQWGHIVSTYMSCNLTKPSDRFIAMSGIAKSFQETNGDTYMAGLWKSIFHVDLAWESRVGPSAMAKRVNDFYAPTWSWASIVGGDVRLVLQSSRYSNVPVPLVKLVTERIIPFSSEGDITGLLRSAELDIKCMLHYYRWMGRSRQLNIYVDEEMTRCRQEFDEEAVSQSLRLDTSDIVSFFSEAHEIKGVCIPLYGVYQGYGGGDNKYLMLQHNSESRYKRIGLLSAGGIGRWIDTWNEDSSASITLI